MAARPSIVGPDAGPESPYPLRMEGKVISGFGRGSKEVRTTYPAYLLTGEILTHQLGIPTANLPVDASITPWIENTPSGVYFGYAALQLPSGHPQASGGGGGGFTVFPMVMSIGYNPFYKNTVRSAEVHVLHDFSADFYDAHMRLLIAGFIREEKDYKSLDALVADIKFDCDVAKTSLARTAWAADRCDGGEWLVSPLDA